MLTSIWREWCYVIITVVIVCSFSFYSILFLLWEVTKRWVDKSKFNRNFGCCLYKEIKLATESEDRTGVFS